MTQNIQQANTLHESDEEIERFRLEQLKEWNEAEEGSPPGVSDDPASAEYAVALHITYIGVDYAARFLMEDHAILSNPNWFRMAYRAHETLFNLYQTIGAYHLSPEGEEQQTTRQTSNSSAPSCPATTSE